MFGSKSFTFGTLWAGALASLSSAAVVVTFDGPDSPPSGTQPGIGSYTEAGFLFEPFDPSLPLRLRLNAGDLSGFPSNGSSYLQLAKADSLRITSLSGLPFTPLSLALSKFSDALAGTPASVAFTGIFPDTSTVTTSFSVVTDPDGPGNNEDFESFVFPGSFAGITALESGVVSSPSNAFSLDDFEVEVVPEPSAAALTLLTLCSILRRRR